MAVLIAGSADAAVRVRTSNVSGVSPFLGVTCNPTTPATTNSPASAEVDIAVNPRNPANQIAAWIDVPRANILTAHTNDAGHHWKLSVPTGLTPCSGGSDPAIEGAADPALSFSPAGEAYLGTLEWKNGYIPPLEDYTEFLYAQSSSNGGATWSSPVSVRTPPKIADKDMILADQQRPDHVYAVYVNNGAGQVPLPRGEGELLFSRSTDGGRTFTTSVLQTSGSLTSFGNEQLSELRDGTLVLTYRDLARNLVARRSTNAGSTWSVPVTVAAPIRNPSPTVCGASLDYAGGSGGHNAVLDGGRTVVVSRVDNSGTPNGPGKILLYKSSDGGRTWTSSVALTTPQPIADAQIAVNKRGQLGVAYYNVDLSHATCSGTSAVVPASTLVRVSNDGGDTWGGAHAIGAPSWNIASGGTANFFFGYWIGDYFAMAGTPQGFAVATVQGTPLSSGRPAVPITGLNSVVVAQVVSASGK